MNVKQELKVLLKEYNGILLLKTVKNENGGPQPSRVIENEKKLKERGKKMGAPIGA